MSITFPKPLRLGESFSSDNKTWIWDGVAWRVDPLAAKWRQTLTAAFLARLRYVADGLSPAVSTTDPDDDGRTYAFSGLAPFEPVEVHLDGLLLPETAYVVDYGISQILLSLTPPNGAIVEIGIYVPPEKMAVGSVNVRPLNSFDIDWGSVGTPPGLINGSRVAFDLYYDVDGTPTPLPPINSVAELAIWVDGVRQEPGQDYTFATGTLTFIEAPSVDSAVWGLWYKPGGPSAALPAVNGWAELPGDMVLEWGQATSTTNAAEVFTFHRPFGAAAYNVQVTMQVGVTVTAITATTFTLTRASAAGSINFQWQAIGPM